VVARGGLTPPSAAGATRQRREGRAFINTEFPHDPRGRDFRDRPDSGAAWLALAGFVGLPLLVGAADLAAIGGGLRGWYMSLAQPPGTPPNWVFSPVWTILYVLIGVAAWLVWRLRGAADPGSLRALRLWGWQLLANAAWAPAFFALHDLGGAVLVMAVLLAMLGATVLAFWKIRPAAGWLLLPYFAWTCYAAYLTVGFWWLNPHA
jgi:tryptophan-rich sensory protein